MDGWKMSPHLASTFFTVSQKAVEGEGDVEIVMKYCGFRASDYDD
jgi:hypothetical protein